MKSIPSTACSKRPGGALPRAGVDRSNAPLSSLDHQRPPRRPHRSIRRCRSGARRSRRARSPRGSRRDRLRCSRHDEDDRPRIRRENGSVSKLDIAIESITGRVQPILGRARFDVPGSRRLQAQQRRARSTHRRETCCPRSSAGRFGLGIDAWAAGFRFRSDREHPQGRSRRRIARLLGQARGADEGLPRCARDG